MAARGYWRDSLAVSGFLLGMMSGGAAAFYVVPATEVPDWLLVSIPWVSAALQCLLGWAVGTRLDQIPRPWVWLTILSVLSILLGMIGGVVALVRSLDLDLANRNPSIPLLLVLHVALTWWIGPMIGGAIDRSRNWRREMSEVRKENA